MRGLQVKGRESAFVAAAALIIQKNEIKPLRLLPFFSYCMCFYALFLSPRSISD